MGKCTFCGKDAGFLKSKHKECEEKYQNGLSSINDLFKNAALSPDKLGNLNNSINSIAQDSFINDEQINDLRISGWESAVDDALSDNLLTETEQDALVTYKKHFDLTQDELNENDSYTNIAKASILREMLNGNLPENVKIEGHIPFNFMKSEKIVWFFPEAEYYERRIRKEYRGGTQGVSLRIAKGVYYRTGNFRGNSVDMEEEVLYIDSGPMVITTKHIYFGGTSKSFRIRLDKIVAIHPYTDGIGVQKDAASAKPQLFVTGDGWFTYNLVTNLSNMIE